jgi:hypothetical protein
MPHPDAIRWDRRYRQEHESWLRRGPSALLVRYEHLLPLRGLALDAAAGVAPNGLFLAARGLRVIALDISELGLRLGVQRAAVRGLPMWGAVCDLENMWLPEGIFQVVVNARYLARAALRTYRKTLQPGGLLFFEAFLAAKGRPVKSYDLLPGELRQEFKDFEVLHSKVVPAIHHPEKNLEQLIARKPRNNTTLL